AEDGIRDLYVTGVQTCALPIFREVLSTLIDRELQLAEVDRYAPPEPSAADVDREVQVVRARFRSPDAFDAVLARSGIDLAHLRRSEERRVGKECRTSEATCA